MAGRPGGGLTGLLPSSPCDDDDELQVMSGEESGQRRPFLKICNQEKLAGARWKRWWLTDYTLYNVLSIAPRMTGATQSVLSHSVKFNQRDTVSYGQQSR